MLIGNQMVRCKPVLDKGFFGPVREMSDYFSGDLLDTIYNFRLLLPD